ncbi:type II secretion system F family protein [Aliidongia dinghuensis]|nr:type II secretion system F family protein [Aliidongia dinghuensis]
MALYRYEAVAGSGKLVTGEMEGESRAAIVAELHRLGHVPIRAEVASERRLARLLPAHILTAPLMKPRRSLGRRSERQLLALTEQLATLLEAGLALDRTLDLAKHILNRPDDREVVQAVLDRVRSGSTLADAMAAEGGFFPRFYIGMVRAGEAGGSLDRALRRIADYLRRSLAIADEATSALIYPSLVLLTGAGTVAMLLGNVVPQFRPMLEQSAGPLPFAAEAVLTASDLVNGYGWAALVFAGLAALAGREALKRPDVRRWRDAWLLRLPRLGDIVVKLEIGRFALTLGTLLGNGLSPLAALKIAEEAVGNRAIAGALAPLGAALEAGKPMATALAEAPGIPPLAVQLIRAGEEAGRLEDMLLKLGEIFDEEARRGIARLLALLVPAVTILLGAVVAAIVGALLTAILSVYDVAA